MHPLTVTEAQESHPVQVPVLPAERFIAHDLAETEDGFPEASVGLVVVVVPEACEVSCWGIMGGETLGSEYIS